MYKISRFIKKVFGKSPFSHFVQKEKQVLTNRKIMLSKKYFVVSSRSYRNKV